MEHMATLQHQVEAQNMAVHKVGNKNCSGYGNPREETLSILKVNKDTDNDVMSVVCFLF